MIHDPPPKRRKILFLQGPPGPFFRVLARELQAKNFEVYRINLSGGDRFDWPDGAVDFQGKFSDWPSFIDAFLRDNQISDLLLFGDCRPYHVSAHGIARSRGVRTHVLEEGYIRPDWMTLELEGVNARSTLSRDKSWFIAEAKKLPAELELPPITASFRRRSRDAYWHYHHVVIGRLRFCHYRSHRAGSIVLEGLGWLWKFVVAKRRRHDADAVLRSVDGKETFVLPLQLSGDYQIRTHSSFPDMQTAAAYAIKSFATHAPADTVLLLKAHPLDCSFFNWMGFVKQQARRHRLGDRLQFVDGGNLDEMVENARGLVCVNSTSATLALARGTPVCTLGEAIYNFAGLTHQQHIDQFWSRPTPPEPDVYAAFRRVLVDRCLIRGGLASESAISTLVENLTRRLLSSARGQSVASQASTFTK